MAFSPVYPDWFCDVVFQRPFAGYVSSAWIVVFQAVDPGPGITVQAFGQMGRLAGYVSLAHRMVRFLFRAEFQGFEFESS